VNTSKGLEKYLSLLHSQLFLYLSLEQLCLSLMFHLTVDKIDDSERLRPEELNQQNIEALVAESNLVLYFLI